MPGSKDIYWANETGEDLAAAVFTRAQAFFRTLPKTLAFQRWVAGWASYCGLPSLKNPFDVAEMGFTGQEGEQVSVRTDDSGSLARHMCQLVTQSRPVLEPVATNSDYASVAQTKAATGILEYIVTHEGLERALYRCNEWAVSTGTGWISTEWDVSYGEVYMVDPETGTPLHEGRFFSQVFAPWDVVVDLRRTDPNHEWVVTRRLVNKWNLVAQYPAHADDILDVKNVLHEWIPQTKPQGGFEGAGAIENDFISVFTLFHDRTPACPDGRWAVVLNGSLILAEGPLPYDTLPIVRHTAGEILNTVHGDSPILHTLGVQQALDNIFSAVVTNNVNLSRQLIAMPKGSEYSRQEIAEGMSVIEVEPNADGSMAEPKAINLVKSSPETYQLIKELIATQGRISGINSIVSGADPALQKELSGSAMLLLEQQTLRYISGVQVSFTQTLEQVGTRLVSILKRFAKSPRLIRIAGKSSAFMMKEFSGRDFEGFDRVEVQQGNPGMRTPAFRLQIAQDLVAKNLITDPAQYLEVLQTGSLDSMTEDRTTDLFNLKRENEILAAAQPQPPPPPQMPGMPPPPMPPSPVRVLWSDNHVEHIKSHKSVLNDPAARDGSPQAEAVAQAVLAHMQEHLNAWRSLAPDILAVMGMPPPPPPPGMMPPPGQGPGPGQGQGGPPPTAAPAHPPPPGPNGMPPAPAPAAPDGSPQKPQLPRNPMDGTHPPSAPGSSGR